MSTVRIGYYDDSQVPGGTTRYLMELIRSLPRDRYSPILFAPAPQPWHDDLRALTTEVVTPRGPLQAGCRGETPPLSQSPACQPRRSRRRQYLPTAIAWTVGLSREAARLISLFRSVPVDLMHTNNAGAEPAPIAARLAGIPRVLGTWHVDSSCDLTGAHSSLRYRLLEVSSMLVLHHAIAVSEATKRDWVGRCRLGKRYEGRVTVIPNGVPPERARRRRTRVQARQELDLPTDAVIIGSLGRLEPAKGYEVLVRALPALIRRVPHVLLAVGGQGSLEHKLRTLARALQVEDHLRLLGFVRETQKLLESLDIYIQPSLSEAQGIAILEAAALGLPVVASDVGGIPETVIHETTGLLVPPGDAAALARALGRLIEDPARALEMGCHGSERVLTHFTAERMISRTISVYDQLLRQFARESRATRPVSEAETRLC